MAYNIYGQHPRLNGRSFLGYSCDSHTITRAGSAYMYVDDPNAPGPMNSPTHPCLLLHQHHQPRSTQPFPTLFSTLRLTLG